MFYNIDASNWIFKRKSILKYFWVFLTCEFKMNITFKFAGNKNSFVFLPFDLFDLDHRMDQLFCRISLMVNKELMLLQCCQLISVDLTRLPTFGSSPLVRLIAPLVSGNDSRSNSNGITVIWWRHIVKIGITWCWLYLWTYLSMKRDPISNIRLQSNGSTANLNEMKWLNYSRTATR
jgi:hypothetical protein